MYYTSAFAILRYFANNFLHCFINSLLHGFINNLLYCFVNYLLGCFINSLLHYLNKQKSCLHLYTNKNSF